MMIIMSGWLNDTRHVVDLSLHITEIYTKLQGLFPGRKNDIIRTSRTASEFLHLQGDRRAWPFEAFYSSDG